MNTTPDFESEFLKIVYGGLGEIIDYTNGLYLIIFLMFGWIIFFSHKEKKRSNKEILILSGIGILWGVLYHWFFDLTSKGEMFATFVTYLVTLLIFRVNLDIRIINIFKRK